MLTHVFSNAVRIFRRSPGTAFTAVVTLAVGIAAPASMFSLATGILGELPFEDPHELVEIELDDLPNDRTNIGATARDLDDWREGQTSFEGLAAVDRRVFHVGGPGPRPARIAGAAISPEAFGLLGTRPVAGRALDPSDAAPGASPAVLLSHRVWADRYDMDESVVGRTVLIDGTRRTVVGVMPEGFAFPRTERLWIPFTGGMADTTRASVFGRLGDGVRPEAAQSDFDRLASNLAAARPEDYRDLTISIHTFAHAELGDGEAALMLYAMTLVLSFVLVIACVNVAHLLLARAAARRREIATRMALGAGGSRVVGSVLGETLLLSVSGGAVGVALAYAAVAWLDARLGPVINLFWATIEIDAAVLAFVAVLVILSALFAGILPARQASSIDLMETLKTRGASGEGRRTGRVTRTLLGAQVAFSCGLLILSGLMVKGLIGLATRDLSFEPDGLLTARVELRASDYPDDGARLAFLDDLERSLDGGPGVDSPAFTSHLPGLDAELRQIALDPTDSEPSAEVATMAVTPGFFETYRSELLAGRLFSEEEARPDGPRVAVVTDVFAERLLPGLQAVGRRIRFHGSEPGMDSDPPVEIVGVVRDGGVFAASDAARPGLLTPLAQRMPGSIAITLRTPVPATAIATLREAVAARDADLPLYEVASLREAILDASVVQRTLGALFGAFGAIALLMAVVGLYAVVAHGGRQRTRELGMRRALGAPRRRIVGLLLRSAVIPLAGGLAVGTGLALALSPALGAALFGVSPRDPFVYALVVLVLSTAALTAALVPSIAAARVDPMRALRAE